MSCCLIIVLIALAGLPALGEQPNRPPTEFESLEITYRMTQDSTLTETREGILRLNDTPVFEAAKQLVIPSLNGTKDAVAKNLALIRTDGTRVEIPSEA